jgi:hypothetical protein
MCGSPDQNADLPAGTDLTKESVLVGKVTSSGSPVGGAFVRLLDSTGEFTAEVVSSATGDYRFFAAPGSWTISVLHRDGKARQQVRALEPGLTEVPITLH